MWEGEKREMGGADDGEEEGVGRWRPRAETLTSMAAATRLGGDRAATSDGQVAAAAARGEWICGDA
uniref:DUF834 domain-containing protein n=1 Tax=Oryza meridionalis TaxID=40149 RepID=A0A0E0CU87_9ORYZ